MSLRSLYELLSTKYRSSAARSVFASDFDGDYSRDCWLDMGRVEVVEEERDEGGDYETPSFYRTVYKLLKPEGEGFYLFECRHDSGDYNPFTGSFRRVSETYSWVIGGGDVEVYQEFYDRDGKLCRTRMDVVRDVGIMALVGEIVGKNKRTAPAYER